MSNIDPLNKYTKMQQSHYDQQASMWSVTNKDPVVGVFDQHNAWEDYDLFLFKDIDIIGKTALEFGCGPGRNIVRFSDRFAQIDGVDISDVNLANAKNWFTHNNLQMIPTLYKNNGTDLSIIDSDKYDAVFSTICLQHICVHEIRFNLFKEFFRVLKNGGSFCAQMGFGTNHPRTAGYYENHYDAEGTNSFHDVRVEETDQLKLDLEKIGFHNFQYDIRAVGPGDGHTNWIFFRATK